MEFFEKHMKLIIVVLIALCALLAGALIYREIDARRVPPLALETQTGIPATATPTATATPILPAATPEAPTTTPTQAPDAIPINSATPEPSQDATLDAIPASAVKPIPGAYGTLTIRKKTFTLKKGIDEKTLAKDIGWMESSAPPGTDGVCVIMGHRNTQFRILKDVERGDTIVITDATGETCSYVVQSARIIEKDSELRFEAGEGKTLVLVTCYPFYFQGHAPHKYVVLAKIP